MVRSREEVIELHRIDKLVMAQPFEHGEFAYLLVPKGIQEGVALLASSLVDTKELLWPAQCETAVVQHELIDGKITTYLELNHLWE